MIFEAIENYTTAIIINSNYVEAYTNRGNAFDDINLPNKALEDYNRALTLAPYDDYLYYNRGVTYNRIEKYDDAKLDFQRSCTLGNDEGCKALQPATVRASGDRHALSPEKHYTQRHK